MKTTALLGNKRTGKALEKVGHDQLTIPDKG